MHASKNSGTSRTFGPFKEKGQPTTTVAICPFARPFSVACQRIGIKLGNRDIRKIPFLSTGQAKDQWSFSGVSCARTSFGADHGERDPHLDPMSTPRQRYSRGYALKEKLRKRSRNETSELPDEKQTDSENDKTKGIMPICDGLRAIFRSHGPE